MKPIQTIFLFSLLLSSHVLFSQNPVISSRPRVLLNSTIKTQLIAKKNANDPTWIALKQQADEFCTWPIVSPYTNPLNHQYRNDEINYYYQGSRWVEVTIPLALAYQITGDTKYSNKLKQLADVIIGGGNEPVQEGLGYAARNVGRAVAIIYDWCYDELTSTQRTGLVTIMKEYHKYLRKNSPSGGEAYQNDFSATGNYYWGHPDADSFMGYAIAGDDNIGDVNITSAEMIAWARQRFNGEIINSLPQNTSNISYRASDWVKQTFDGGYPSLAGRGTNLTDDKGNPHKGGIHVQGWSYGSDVFSQYIDYVQLVKTATNEDLITPNEQWWIDMLKAQKHSLLPNGYHNDEMGDNGTNYGIRLRKALPLRLAYVLQGTIHGQRAQQFLQNELLSGPDWDDEVVDAEPWEKFYYSTNQAPATFTLPLYYSGFNNGLNLGKGNGSTPYFLMRDKWGVNGTWISFQASSATIDDHDHFNAGNIDINHKGEYLLSSPSESNYAEHSGASNTFYLNDRGDFQSTDYRRVGGQSTNGRNQIKAVNQTDSITYVRAVLTTAYNKSEQNLITVPANRKLNYFFRSFLYIRPSNVVVVYDQTNVKSPAAGSPYNRHLRWHFADNGPQPVVSGKKIKSAKGNSVLNVHTVLPATATITLVDQRNNPDAGTFGTDYYFDSDTWRAEVAGNLSLNETDYLTVLQPGSNTMIEMETVSLTSVDGKMDGVLIKTNNAKRHDLVFFNKEDVETQAPITDVILPVAGVGKLMYTIAGMEADALYNVTVAGDGTSLTLQKNAAGTIGADVAGVVRFLLDGNNPVDGGTVTGIENDLSKLIEIYPNPSEGVYKIQTELLINRISIVDATGKLILTRDFTDQIDLRGLKAGIYFIRCYTSSGVAVKKLVLTTINR